MKYAIIGAGITGLSIAHGLKAMGKHVDIFEKSRGSGGRMSTKRMEYGNVDLGAQYFTAKDPGFKRWVDYWCKQDLCNQWPFSPHKQTHKGLTISPDRCHRYIGADGMSAITRALAKPLPVHYQCMVNSANFNGSQWQLLDATNKPIGDYDWLICTQPLEQTRTVLKQKPQLLSYLPEEIHHPCWAVALHTTEHNIVNSDIAGVFAKPPLSWVTRTSSKPTNNPLPENQELWICHFDKFWSETQGKTIAPNQLIQTALDWLSDNIGGQRQLMNYHSQYWRYAKIVNPTATTPALIDQDDQLVIAGAWAAGDRVEGGYLSSRYCLEQLGA